MHATKILANSVKVSIELGKTGGKNPEHIANVHLVLEVVNQAGDVVGTIGRIRGILAYLKSKGGRAEWVLRYPGYKGGTSRYETAYIQLSDEISQFICDTLEQTDKDTHVAKYSGDNNWTIWKSRPVVEARNV